MKPLCYCCGGETPGYLYWRWIDFFGTPFARSREEPVCRVCFFHGRRLGDPLRDSPKYRCPPRALPKAAA